MEISVMNMCRCCSSEGAFKDIKSTYHWMGEDEVYGDMLKECFDITLTLPEVGECGICEVCITQLRNAVNFKKQVLHTEEQFRKQIQNKFFKPNIVKVEVPIEDVMDSDDQNLSADDSLSVPEIEVPIKVETVDEVKPKKRSAMKPSTSRTKKIKPNDNDYMPPSREQQKEFVLRRTKAVESSDSSKFEMPKDEIYLQRWNVKEIIQNSNATPIRRYCGIGYMCSYCSLQYPQAADLKQHTLSSHTDVYEAYFMKNLSLYEFAVKLDITDLRCSICDTDMDTLHDFIRHLIQFHDKTIHMKLRKRIIPVKFKGDVLQCDLCLCEFRNLKVLLTHMNIHYRNYICSICDAGFVTQLAHKYHVFNHDIGEYQCSYCPKVFSSHYKKIYHEKGVHKDSLRRNKCGYCTETFRDYFKKTAHLYEVHGIKPRTFNCQACEKTFSSQMRLTIHINQDHLLLRPHKCPWCIMSFYSSTSLKDHMMTHTKQKNYQCDYCHKWYARRSTMIQHLRIHANDRRYKCVYCEKSFIQKCSWRTHMKNKHNEYV